MQWRGHTASDRFFRVPVHAEMKGLDVTELIAEPRGQRRLSRPRPSGDPENPRSIVVRKPTVDDVQDPFYPRETAQVFVRFRLERNGLENLFQSRPGAAEIELILFQ